MCSQFIAYDLFYPPVIASCKEPTRRFWRHWSSWGN